MAIAVARGVRASCDAGGLMAQYAGARLTRHECKMLLGIRERAERLHRERAAAPAR